MKKIVLGLSACLAVALLTMGQVPVSITPGGPSMLNAFTPIGGTTSSFPALKRSTDSLQCRVADDSAFCDITVRNSLFTAGLFAVNLIASTTAPTISSGFGASPAILSSNGTSSFRVNVGTGGAATTGVIGLPAAATGWNCQVTDFTTNVVTRETASSTTTVSVTAASAWGASDTLVFNCAAY